MSIEPNGAERFLRLKEDMHIAGVMKEIHNEVAAAMERYPAFNSAHEGYAVIKEEVDELWDEVKVKQGSRDLTKLRKEAVQVAAMALRFIVDVCDGQRGQR